MDKSGILGGALEQLGGVAKQTGKQLVKAPLDISKGALEQVSGQQMGEEGTPPLAGKGQKDIGALRAEEEEERAKNLAITRQNLAEIMRPKGTQAPRPAEKVKMEEQQKLEALQQKQAKKPPPLPVTARPGTVERKLGVSG